MRPDTVNLRSIMLSSMLSKKAAFGHRSVVLSVILQQQNMAIRKIIWKTLTYFWYKVGLLFEGSLSGFATKYSVKAAIRNPSSTSTTYLCFSISRLVLSSLIAVLSCSSLRTVSNSLNISLRNSL